MKKIILITIASLIFVGSAFAWYMNSTQYVKGIASTLTDTLGPFSAGDYTYGYLISDLDLESSTTITQTVRPMVNLPDGTKKFVGQAITIASAITSDQSAIKTLLRNKDTNQIPVPEFYLQRVTPVTGDSVTDRKIVSFWGK